MAIILQIIVYHLKYKNKKNAFTEACIVSITFFKRTVNAGYITEFEAISLITLRRNYFLA